MATEQPNPYSSPTAYAPAESTENVDPALQKKIEAIIKDAGQFWLAIIMCIICTGVGGIIIGPWYLVRLLQWNSIAREQPMLLDPNVPRGSIADKFQSAKIKLIIGMGFGILILSCVALMIVVSMSLTPSA